MNEKPCPICGRPADPERRPFCSPRCRDVDLGRWFAGSYRVEADPALDLDEGDDAEK